MVYGIEVLYNILRRESAGLKGIIFAFHGCEQWVTEWGYRSQACNFCAGELLLCHTYNLQTHLASLQYTQQEGCGCCRHARGDAHGGQGCQTQICGGHIRPLLTANYYRCYEKVWPPENGLEIPEVIGSY